MYDRWKPSKYLHFSYVCIPEDIKYVGTQNGAQPFGEYQRRRDVVASDVCSVLFYGGRHVNILRKTQGGKIVSIFV